MYLDAGTVIVAFDLIDLKALAPTVLFVSAVVLTVISARLLHPSNADLPTSFIFFDIVTEVRCVLHLKAEAAILSTTNFFPPTVIFSGIVVVFILPFALPVTVKVGVLLCT